MSITIETHECVQVIVLKEQGSNPDWWNLLSEFIRTNNLYSIVKGGEGSPSHYVGYHSKEDAEKIKQFVEGTLNKNEGICLNCKKEPATRGIGERKVVCSKCWNAAASKYPGGAAIVGQSGRPEVVTNKK